MLGINGNGKNVNKDDAERFTNGLGSLIRHLGPLEDFNSMYGPHEQIPLKGTNTFIFVPPKEERYDGSENSLVILALLNEGMDGVIHYLPYQGMSVEQGFGTPVRPVNWNKSQAYKVV